MWIGKSKCCLRCINYKAYFKFPLAIIKSCGSKVSCIRYGDCDKCLDFRCDCFKPESQTDSSHSLDTIPF